MEHLVGLGTGMLKNPRLGQAFYLNVAIMLNNTDKEPIVGALSQMIMRSNAIVVIRALQMATRSFLTIAAMNIGEKRCL